MKIRLPKAAVLPLAVIIKCNINGTYYPVLSAIFINFFYDFILFFYSWMGIYTIFLLKSLLVLCNLYNFMTLEH